MLLHAQNKQSTAPKGKKVIFQITFNLNIRWRLYLAKASSVTLLITNGARLIFGSSAFITPYMVIVFRKTPLFPICCGVVKQQPDSVINSIYATVITKNLWHGCWPSLDSRLSSGSRVEVCFCSSWSYLQLHRVKHRQEAAFLGVSDH